MGRPTKLTPKIQERIVTAIAAGNYAEVAARYAGIGDTTYYAWMQRGEREESGIYREFRNAVKTAEAQSEVYAVTVIRQAFSDNWQAAMTYLERKYPDRWGRRDRVIIERSRALEEARRYAEENGIDPTEMVAATEQYLREVSGR